jgi:Domain of unknown function (DUF305)
MLLRCHPVFDLDQRKLPNRSSTLPTDCQREAAAVRENGPPRKVAEAWNHSKRDAFSGATPVMFRGPHKTLQVAAGTGGTAVSPTFRLSVGSHLAAIAVGAVAAAAYLTVYSNSPQSLADYISAICAKSFGSAPAAEAPYLAESVSAMTTMMIDMGIRPSGDVDTDFVAMMVPHHQGAIDMALAVLRHSRNPQIRRLAQEIIVTQQQEIAVMRLAVGQPLPPPGPSPTQVPSVRQIDPKSSQLTDRAKEP